jgi:hypothetical protein
MASLLFPTLPKDASDFLIGLASGKYDGAIAGIDKLLTTAGAVIPQAVLAKEILDGLVALNKATAPVAVQSDGRGGFVPTSNSRFDPATGEFL